MENSSSKTSWDEQLDAKRLKTWAAGLEKMVSGNRISRRADENNSGGLKTKGLLLVDQKRSSTELGRHGSFTTQHMCNVESDPLGEFELCWACLVKARSQQGYWWEQFHLAVCLWEAVSRRCCLTHPGGRIAALLKKMDDKDVTVAVDGSHLRYHPHSRTRLSTVCTAAYGIRIRLGSSCQKMDPRERSSHRWSFPRSSYKRLVSWEVA